jgi:filamentous hemagglutinin
LGERELGEVPRPSARQSEIDVGKQLSSDFKPQASYSYEKEVRYGARDSKRPDFVSAEKNVSIEVKNYDIAKNANKLVRDTAKQAIERVEHLPEDMQQRVIIDIRGQDVTPEVRSQITTKIIDKTSGIISNKQIRFIKDNNFKK